MAWPFPSGVRGVTAGECVRLTGRVVSCEDGWRSKEQLVAGLMVGVAIAVVAWMALIIATPAVHPTWARDTLRLPSRPTSAEADGDEEQRVIEYEPYADEPGLSEAERKRRQEIKGLNDQSRLALHVEGSRIIPSSLLREQNYRPASFDD